MGNKHEIERDDLIVMLRALHDKIEEHNLDEDSIEARTLRKWEERLGGSFMYGTID